MMRARSSGAALVAAVMVGAASGTPAVAVAQEAWALDEDWPRYPADMFEMGTGVAVGEGSLEPHVLAATGDR